MNRSLLATGFALAAALWLPACGGADDEDDGPTGVVVDPAETLDFGTVYECTQHLEDVVVTNHGPEDVDLEVNVDQLIAEGFLVSSFAAEVPIDAGDDHAVGVRLEPLEGHAGLKDAILFLDIYESDETSSPDRSIQIRIIAEVVEGNECP